MRPAEYVRVITCLLPWLFCASTALADGGASFTSQHVPKAAGFAVARGHVSGGVQYVGRTPEYTVGIYADGSTASALSDAAKSSIQMQFIGSNRSPYIVEQEPLPSHTYFYRGAVEAAWQTNLPIFKTIGFRNLYPGIDLSYQMGDGAIEYVFTVGPGGDAGLIRMRFTEGWQVSIADTGDLNLKQGDRVWRHRKPVAFQIIRGRKVEIGVAFQVSSQAVGFRLEEPYDSTLPLIIDPVVTSSQYVGGSGWDAAYSVTTDPDGAKYVTGDTESVDFPGQSSAGRSNRDVFVTKIKNGAVVYTTILSSSGSDVSSSIALAPQGGVCISGTAGAADFPTTAGTVQRSFGGAQDAFVACLDASGNLQYSTFLGGSLSDVATGLAIDAAGNVYVAGYTASTNFQTSSGAPQTQHRGGINDGFVSKLNASLSSYVYATFIGGTGNDLVMAISVDSTGNAILTGTTDSSNLPTRNAFQAASGGGFDAFAVSVNAYGTGWNFVTYLGGSGSEQGNAVATDVAGNIYIAGSASSENFPVSASAFQLISRGSYDAFVTKLSALGGLVYSTLLGGTAAESAQAIAVDSATGEAWVGGFTASTNFPVRSPLQSTNLGAFDGFVSQLNSAGSDLKFSTYWGGSNDDRLSGLCISAGQIVATGYTSSANLTTTIPGGQPVGGDFSGFLVEIRRDPSIYAVQVSPSSGTGLQQSFAFVAQDTRGYAALGTVLMLVHDTIAYTGGCQFLYDAVQARFYLYHDTSGWLGPLTAGGAGTLNNGRCVLSGSGTSASGSGINLTVTLNVSFTGGFSGAKKVYLYAQEGMYGTAGMSTGGWQQMGTWTIPQASVTAVSVSPSSGSWSGGPAQFVAQDSIGYAALGTVLVLVHDTVAYSGGCQFR
jgi:hypothetical protein